MDNFFFSFLMFILDLPSNTIHVPSSLLMCFFEFLYFRSTEPHSVLQLPSLIYLILRETMKTCNEDFILDPCCMYIV